MRELEFLPEWYPQIRHKKRLVIVYGWLTVLVVVTVGFWLLMAQRNVHLKEGELVFVKGQLTETKTELERLDELLLVQRKLNHQDQIIVKLGKHIEASRLMAALDQLMPETMALVGVQIDTEEQVLPAGSLAAARAAEDATKPRPRTMRVKLQGLVPTDEDLANFLSKLTARPFEHAALAYSRQRTDAGHVMREFEVTFAMDLNAVGVE